MPSRRTSARLLCASALLLPAGAARATPSSIIWIPSTDIQKFATVHLGDDAFVRVADEPSGQRRPPIVVLGPLVGVLPFKKLQLEVGFDLFFQGVSSLDAHPLSFHAKLGTPQGSLFRWSPALAVGIYDAGIARGLTDFNLGYGLASWQLPYVGRFAGGYYLGNTHLLRDRHGEPAGAGLLLSWDRTMKELTHHLWLAADYQGGQSALGAVNFGGAWRFTEKISVLVGYDHYLDRAVAGQDTVTVQVDIDI